MVRRLLGGVPAELGRVDRDRRRGRRHCPPVGQGEHRPAGHHAGVAQQPLAGAHEVPAVQLGVERHDVGAEQAEQDFAAPREARVDIRRRPRYVQEEPHRLVGPPLPDHLRDEHEVVIVHPRQRARPRVKLGERRVREGGVHLPVGIPPGTLESRLLDRVVQQRPEGRVGEAVVVVADLRSGEADRSQLSAEIRQGGRNALRAAVPSHPGAAAARHHRPQRGYQPARRQLPPAVAVLNRQPVGHGHDRLLILARGCLPVVRSETGHRGPEILTGPPARARGIP